MIRRAAESDAAALSELAIATFIESYEDRLPKPELTRFSQERYPPEKTLAELREENSFFYLAEGEDSRAVGYLRMRLHPAPPCVKGPLPIELSRIYLRRGAQGLGLGARLFETALSCARQRGRQTLWLPVWEKNEKALGFYRKLGFTHAGEQEFRFFSERQRDLVLERPVG